jgi:hypothetical protein
MYKDSETNNSVDQQDGNGVSRRDLLKLRRRGPDRYDVGPQHLVRHGSRHVEWNEHLLHQRQGERADDYLQDGSRALI